MSSELRRQLDTARQLVSRQQWDAALTKLAACAAESPQDADVLYLLGRVHKALGALDSSERYYRQAIAVRPEDPDIWTSLGILHRARDRLPAAIEAYERAIALDPAHIEANANLANALAAAGVPELAEEARLRAAAALETRVTRLCDAAAAASDLGRSRQALATLEAALRFAPKSAGLTLRAAMLAADLGLLERSLQHAEEAFRLDPHSAVAAEFARQRSFVAGLPEPAMRYSQVMRELSPATASPASSNLFLPAIPSSLEAIRSYRGRYETGLDEVLTGNTPPVDTTSTLSAAFYLAYHGANDRVLQTKAARMYLRAAPGLAWTAPHCIAASRRPGRIRVGFISKFFSEHSIGKTSRGIIEHLDRTRFEVHAIRITPSAEDEITRRIVQAADRGTVLDRDFGRARAQLAALGLDILFYQDIGMEPTSYFLAFARLAPVQCVSYGHPNTTGIPNVDYFVSNDLYELPDAQSHYSEQLFLLHDLPTLAYYYRPRSPSGPVSKERFGIPRGANLYLCPQTLFKIHPDFDALVGGILARDPAGCALFIQGDFPRWAEILEERFSRTVPGVASRIRFLPRMGTTAFLELLGAADVILDTLHFNGMNSSLEAFAMGTPVVTLPTQLQRGRHTQAMYRKMKLDGCIATTPEEYVEMAVRIGTDRGARAALRSRILDGNGVLYEDTRVVREFERFFLESFESAQGGLRATGHACASAPVSGVRL